jgi:hypothetical protein
LLFQKQWEDSDVMLASTQETSLIKKVNSILIQAVYTGKEAHGIVAPCAKSLHHGPFPQTTWQDAIKDLWSRGH